MTAHDPRTTSRCKRNDGPAARAAAPDVGRFERALGLRSTSAYAVGIEVAVEAEKLGNGLLERYPKALVVAGQLIFEEDTGLNRILHGETAFLIQRRLQNAGVPMIVLPVQLDLKPFAGKTPRSRRIDGSMDRWIDIGHRRRGVRAPEKPRLP